MKERVGHLTSIALRAAASAAVLVFILHAAGKAYLFIQRHSYNKKFGVKRSIWEEVRGD